MNTSILQKCITELQKETPDLSYLRGMLETLLEMQGNSQLTNVPYGATAILSDVGSAYSFPTPSFPTAAKMVSADSPEGRAVEAALASLQGMPTPKPSVQENNVILN